MERDTPRETAREWLNLELDGRLSPDLLARLETALAVEPHLVRERTELARLDRLLAASRVPVDSQLRRRVMADLPAAGWEARSSKSWRAAVALLLLLGGAAAALVGMGSARLVPASPFLGAVSAVADLFTAAALTGAGLLAASWKGLGLALGELAGGSVTGIAALAVLVLCLNLLFFSLLRGATRAAVAPAERRDGPGAGRVRERTERPRGGGPPG